MKLPPELRLQIMEYLIDEEDLPEIHYQPDKSRLFKITKHHPLTLTCKTLSNEFRKVQSEQPLHVMDMLMPPDTSETDNPDLIATLSPIKRVKIVAGGNLEPHHQLQDEFLRIASALARFPNAHDKRVELQMGYTNFRYVLVNVNLRSVNHYATRLKLKIDGGRECSRLPEVFMYLYLARIFAQFPNATKIEVDWVAHDEKKALKRWRKTLRKTLRPLRKRLRKVIPEGTELILRVRSG
jgi:hypothetical protein